MVEDQDAPDAELINDVYQDAFAFRFGRLPPITVDPNRWDGRAEALVADVRTKERRLLGKARMQLAQLAVEEQRRYEALDEATRTMLGGPGAFYDDELAEQREQVQQALTAALTDLIVELLWPYLQPDNPDLTPDDLRRLKLTDRVKLLSFFERPASALAQHRAAQVAAQPTQTAPASLPTTPASPDARAPLQATTAAA